MFADAEVQVTASPAPRLKVSCARKLEGGAIRGSEIRRAAQEPWDAGCERIENRASRIAPRDALCISGEDREICFAAPWQLTPLHVLDLRGKRRVGRAIALEPLAPGKTRRSATRSDPSGKVLAHALGHQELRILGPAVAALARPHLLEAERLTVGFSAVVLVRG